MWNICPYFYLRATPTATKKAAKYQIKYLKIHKVARIGMNEIAKGGCWRARKSVHIQRKNRAL